MDILPLTKDNQFDEGPRSVPGPTGAPGPYAVELTPEEALQKKHDELYGLIAAERVLGPLSDPPKMLTPFGQMIMICFAIWVVFLIGVFWLI